MAPGRRWSFTLPPDATALAHDMKTERTVAFSRPIGAGSLTVLGFNLQYVPNEQDDQKDFLERLVTGGGARQLATRASDRHIAAMQLHAPTGCFVCLANPVELAATTRVRCTTPDGGILTFPTVIKGVGFEGAGARLLPVGLDLPSGLRIAYSTWELLEVSARGDGPAATFSSPGSAQGEICIVGTFAVEVDGARLVQTQVTKDGTVLVLEPQGGLCSISIGAAGGSEPGGHTKRNGGRGR